MLRQRKPASSTSPEPFPAGKGWAVTWHGHPCKDWPSHQEPDLERSSPHFWATWQWEESPFPQDLPQCFRSTKKIHETERHRLTGGIAALQIQKKKKKAGLSSLYYLPLGGTDAAVLQNNLSPSVYLSRNSSWMLAVCCSSVWKASIIKSRTGKTKADLSDGWSPLQKRSKENKLEAESFLL